MSDTAHQSLSQKKILIVEDDAFIGDIILKQLLQDHSSTRLVSSGAEAKDALLKEMPDMLILDIFLPDINGLDLLESLRKDAQTKDLQVLVLSNSDQPKDRERAKELGASFLMKAVTTPIEIAKDIEKMLSA